MAGKNIIIIVFAIISPLLCYSQAGTGVLITVANSTDSGYVYNSTISQVWKARFLADPTGQTNKWLVYNGTNGWSWYQNWIQSGSDIYYSAGKVAIGTSTFAGGLNFGSNTNIGTDIGSTNYKQGTSVAGAFSSGNYNMLKGISILNLATTVNHTTAIGNALFNKAGTSFASVALGKDIMANATGTVQGIVGLGNGVFNTAGTISYSYGIGETLGNAASSATRTMLIGRQNFDVTTGTLTDIYGIGYQMFRGLTGNTSQVLSFGNGSGNAFTSASNVVSLSAAGNLKSTTDLSATAVIAIANGAGSSASKVDSCIFIGLNAGASNAWFNAINIGINATSDQSNQIVLGNSSHTQLRARNFRFNIDATPSTGNLLVWDGTEFSPANTSAGLDANYWKIGGQAFTVQPTIGPSGTRPMHFQTNGTRRFSIPSSGIANTPSSTKALVLSSTDSLGYTTLQSSDWTNTVTQSGSDTLLNSAAGYGHFQRIGNVVSFTLRVEIALASAGDANTVYIDPPIASNFTTAASDVIGTATMDPQSLSGANTQRQRCVVFASDSDDKIGVSFDPVASLTYPENRMYISVSGSYVIQ